MINKLISDHGGKVKYSVLKKHLEAQGYYFLIEKLETMGFTIDDEGYVKSSRG